MIRVNVSSVFLKTGEKNVMEARSLTMPKKNNAS
jgi:hypothetical protein